MINKAGIIMKIFEAVVHLEADNTEDAIARIHIDGRGDVIAIEEMEVEE